jgi:hypothetical protein
MDKEGEMHQVYYKVCILIGRKQKLLVPKLDILLKHQGHRKAEFSLPNVDFGTFYFNKKLVHA